MVLWIEDSLFFLWHAWFYSAISGGNFSSTASPYWSRSYTVPHRTHFHTHTERKKTRAHTFFTLSLQSLDLALKYCNYFFTSTFVLESVLKLIAFGVRRFFKDRYSLYLHRMCDCIWECFLYCPHLSLSVSLSVPLCTHVDLLIFCLYHRLVQSVLYLKESGVVTVSHLLKSRFYSCENESVTLCLCLFS